MTLHVDEKVNAEAPFRTQSSHFALCGKVVYDVADDVYIDFERKPAAAMARD